MEENKVEEKIVSTSSQNSINNNDTLIVTEKCAVMYWPDSLQTEKLKKQLGEDTFHIGADDCAAGLNDASMFLEKQKLKIFNTSQKFILFKSFNSTIIIQRDTLSQWCGVFLFQPSQQPKSIDYYNIEEEFKNYFK